MSRYINIDKVLGELGLNHNDYVYIDKNETAERIRKIPSIEIEPKRGDWIPVKASIYPYGNDVKCSVCGHRMGSSFGYNYCPNCGAHMKGADDE